MTKVQRQANTLGKFGVLKLDDGGWIATYNGQIFMPTDNSYELKKPAIESAAYHAEMCRNDPEYEHRIAADVDFFRRARNGELPIRHDDLWGGYVVGLPDSQEGPFLKELDAQHCAKRLQRERQ